MSEEVQDTDVDVSPAEDSSPEVDSSPVQGEPSSAPSYAESAEPQPQGSVWDAFKQLPQFQGQDDRAIASNLYQALQREQAATHALRQYQQVLPVAQEYMNYRPQFQQWLEQQRQQPAPQPEEPKKWWNPPEVKESHRRYLVKDEAGRDAISPNAPLDAQQALTEWMTYRADFAQKFLSNPEEALGPMISEMAERKAQEIVHGTFEQRAQEDFVSRFEQENADWLYDSSTGSVSVQGAAFHKYVEQARSMGIPPGEPRAQFAHDMVELELWREKGGHLLQPQAPAAPQVQAPAPVQQQPQPQQPQPQDRAQQNMDYLRREASRSPSRSAGTSVSDPRRPSPPRSFVQMLHDSARESGIIQ